MAWWKNFVLGTLGRSQGSSNTLIEDLQKNSSRLETLLDEFGVLTKQGRTRKGIEVRCFYETRTTQVWNAVTRAKFVPKPEEVIVS
jgi:hypothetical protein